MANGRVLGHLAGLPQVCTTGTFFKRITCLAQLHLKARLHGSPRLINAVELMKSNSTVERYCLHGSTKVNEAVDFKMAANELFGKVL